MKNNISLVNFLKKTGRPEQDRNSPVQTGPCGKKRFSLRRRDSVREGTSQIFQRGGVIPCPRKHGRGSRTIPRFSEEERQSSEQPSPEGVARDSVRDRRVEGQERGGKASLISREALKWPR